MPAAFTLGVKSNTNDPQNQMAGSALGWDSVGEGATAMSTALLTTAAERCGNLQLSDGF